MQHSFLMPALIGFLVMLNMSMFASFRIDRSRRRLAELDRLKDLLPRHYAALDRVDAADGIPRDMKDVAIWVSNAIEDEAAAQFFADWLQAPHGHGPYVFDGGEIDLLRTNRPDLMEIYEEAVGSGILASLLRWPQTARNAGHVMDRLLVARHEETAMVVRAAKERHHPAGSPALQAAF